VPAKADVVFQTATFDASAPGFGNVLALQGDGTTQGNALLGGKLCIGADFGLTHLACLLNPLTGAGRLP
jgi:hypothetical protein